MKKAFLIVATLALIFAISVETLTKKSKAAPPLETLKERFEKKPTPSADHSKFTQLRKKFHTPQEVTQACIGCHTERHTEVMASSHWNWERQEYVEGKGIRSIGKKNLLNNYCIGISSNEESCNKCHIGYGWADRTFDFNNPLNVDCLACHDGSNTYVKQSGGAGMPDPSVDLSFVAQRVGRPTRSTCGSCHFFGGGGNNVKHGDLEEAMFEPTKDIDAHMGYDGSNMQCVDCHTAEKHQMLGKSYSLSSMNRQRSSCEQCHTNLPHESSILNEHTLKVACQTCHIPVYAKVNPTKMSWDWSTAGKLKNGKPYEERDTVTGKETYSSLKGTFVWKTNVIPEYIWFNGTASHYVIGDTVAENGPTRMNTLYGSYSDPDAKIIPVKIHRAKQIYDTQNLYLIQPKTTSEGKWDGGYWANFDWKIASEIGMKQIGLPFSGEYGFVETEMTWPLNHMVSEKDKAVPCAECHTSTNGRLANLKDFYLPGRDRNPFVETAGVWLIALALAGVFVHAGARIVMRRKN